MHIRLFLHCKMNFLVHYSLIVYVRGEVADFTSVNFLFC